VDFLTFVPDIHVSLFEVFSKPGNRSLDRKMIDVNGAQQEQAHFMGAAETQKLLSVRSRALAGTVALIAAFAGLTIAIAV
jgi:hypothetical protein